MPEVRATWPRWARNAFILQLLLNCALAVLLTVLHFVGQANDRAEREALRVEIASLSKDLELQKEAVDGAEAKLRDWWAIDTRNMRERVREDVEKMLEQGRKAAPEGD